MDKNRIARFIGAQTAIFALNYETVERPLTEFEEQIQKKLRTTDWGCNSRATKEAFKDSMYALAASKGVTIDPRIFSEGSGGMIEFVPFSLVVPIANPNSHDYTIGKPCLTQPGTSRCIPYDMGSNNMTREKDALRPATAEEIHDFVDKVDLEIQEPDFVKNFKEALEKFKSESKPTASVTKKTGLGARLRAIFGR